MPSQRAGVEWIKTPEQAINEVINAHIELIDAAIFGLCKRREKPIENQMSSNAPWTDRSGNARQGLWTGTTNIPRMMTTLTLSHGVEYGFWLEVRWGGRFAIVLPTWDQQGVLLFNEIQSWFA